MPGPRSGVSVPENIVDIYLEMKLQHKYRSIQFKLAPEQNKLVIGRVDHVTSQTTSYEDFINGLQMDECGYYLYDFQFQLRNGTHKNRLLFIMWIPEHATVKQKMVYTSTADTLEDKLQGGILKIQANDLDDLEKGQIEMQLKSLDRSG